MKLNGFCVSYDLCASPPPDKGFTITCFIYHPCSSPNMHHYPFYVINYTDMLHPYNDVL